MYFLLQNVGYHGLYFRVLHRKRNHKIVKLLESTAIVFHYLAINTFPRQITIPILCCKDIIEKLTTLLFDIQNPISYTSGPFSAAILDFVILSRIMLQCCAKGVKL